MIFSFLSFSRCKEYENKHLLFKMKCQKSCGMCTRMKFSFKYQQCGKRKEKSSRTVVIQMATMHSKLGISLSNLVYV
jgi:hypothetical protein